MHLLYIGDVMGEMGIEVVEQVLPGLRRAEKIDVVIAQAENVSGGKGLNVADYERLKAVGVDGFSGGNHTPSLPETLQLLRDPDIPVVAPANMPDVPGSGYTYVLGAGGSKVLLISLLGKIVGRDADRPIQNPLHKIDEILARENFFNRGTVVVNFHGDYSSEKVVIGHYLDGKVSVAVGDHWHVPTADARVLPGGTAHQTDVGMCGVLDSSLGVAYDSVIPRWRDGRQTRNVLQTAGPRQFNALLVAVDDQTHLATSARAVQKIL
ncbi:MAG TPA: TIGR00282 family metallophosphoesterase [Candidatus Saccharimonadales bacterium]